MTPSYNNNPSSAPGPGDIFSKLQPNMAFIVLIFAALIAFEIFNYSTTDHALSDLLGDLSFAGLPWSTVLAFAFCGIDFAGIARLFTPEQGKDEPKEVWYLFGAWLIAATMNAILTWWGVSMAVTNHQIKSATTVVDQATVATIVPVFVAVMVWVIRILIIGTLSLALDRMMHPGAQPRTFVESMGSFSRAERPVYTPRSTPQASIGGMSARPQNNPSRANAAQQRYAQRAEPSYEGDEELNIPTTRHEASYHSLAARPAGRNGGSGSGESGSGSRGGYRS